MPSCRCSGWVGDLAAKPVIGRLDCLETGSTGSMAENNSKGDENDSTPRLYGKLERRSTQVLEPLISALKKCIDGQQQSVDVIAKSLVEAARFTISTSSWRTCVRAKIKEQYHVDNIRMLLVSESFERHRRRKGQHKASMDAGKIWGKPLSYSDRRRKVEAMPFLGLEQEVGSALIIELERALKRNLRFSSRPSADGKTIVGGPDIRALVVAWNIVAQEIATSTKRSRGDMRKKGVHHPGASTWFVSLIRSNRRRRLGAHPI